MREILPSVQSAYVGISTWGTPSPLRIDFSRLKELAVTDSFIQSPGHSKPPSDWITWEINSSLNKVVFIKDKNTPLRLFWQNENPMLAISPDQVVYNDQGQARTPSPSISRWEYSTHNIANLLSLEKSSLINLLPRGWIASGVFIQAFTDAGMGDKDWVSLGFSPPRHGRPALDSRGGGKDLMQKYICVSHQDLDVLEESCANLWKSYADSSWEGVYFCQLEVANPVWSGITAAMAPGSVVKMSPDFLPGLPYRPTWSKFTADPSKLPPPRSYSVVFSRSGQHVEFDPHVQPLSQEISVKWKSASGLTQGVFTAQGRYRTARKVRKTHYVSPRTQTRMVWEQGSPHAISEKCLLSPESGGIYTPRPSREEYRQLVSKYGKAAVPKNFNKYKESQIAQKSDLVECVESGEWIFVPHEQSPETVTRAAFDRLGKPPLPWRILRQIHLSDEAVKDPFEGGIYARIISREDLFASPQRMQKMIKMMKADGWDFILEETLSVNSDLKRGIFSAITI